MTISRYDNSNAAQVYNAVKNLLSRSSAFQTFVDKTSASTALSRIYLEGFPESPVNGQEYSKSEYQSWLPCAIIRLPYEDAGLRGSLADFSSTFELSGSIDIIFETAVPENSQRNNIPKPDFMYDFVTHISQIIDELVTLRGQPSTTEKVFDFHGYSFLTFLYTPATKAPNTGLNIQTIVTLEYGREGF